MNENATGSGERLLRSSRASVQTESMMRVEPELPLDAGIKRAVHALNDAGIATWESCEGGSGHSFPEPTVRFRGDQAEALRAVAAVVDIGLPVISLRKVWWVSHGELEGPWWEVVFPPATGHVSDLAT